MLSATLPMVYPGKANTRRPDPTTSHEAADTNDTAESRRNVLRLLIIAGPLADHELVDMYEVMVARHGSGQWKQFTPQRLRTARAELTETGAVEFTGIYRLTPTNRRAQVWAVA